MLLRPTTAEVLRGDCRKLVPTLGQFDFICCDPPFNIGQRYGGYDDQRDDYEEFTLQGIRTMWDACDGVLALHGPDDRAEAYLMAAATISGCVGMA